MADDDKKPASSEDVAGLKTDLANVSAEVKQFAEDTQKAVAAGNELSTELKANIDKALSEQGAIRARVDELEQKAARTGPQGGGVDLSSSPGAQFTNNEKVKAFIADRTSRGRVRVDMAAITTVTAGATRNVLVPPDRLPGIITAPQRRMTVRDLITPGRTSQNSIQYVREVGFSNAAGVVSEGALKPESDIDFELITTNVATIAHFIVASKQILDDAPMLESHIDGRLRYGLAFVEETQLLNGDGTGNNLHGLIPLATAFVQNFVPEMPTRIDDLRLAILQSELALFPSTGIVLNPIDWARIELTKTTVGEYIFEPGGAGGPQLSAERLWSRPVVSTPAMTNTHFLTGAFQLGAQIFDREDAGVELSTEDSDNFRRNLVTLRAEERLALAVYRPESLIYGQFQTGT
jgi:HK97 family phage major capsid protein